MKDQKNHEGLRQAWKAFSMLSGIGIYLAVVVGICLYMGNMADEQWELGIKGKLTGILLGFPIAFYSLYRRLKDEDVI